jgi:hypothetical protein
LSERCCEILQQNIAIIIFLFVGSLQGGMDRFDYGFFFFYFKLRPGILGEFLLTFSKRSADRIRIEASGFQSLPQNTIAII